MASNMLAIEAEVGTDEEPGESNLEENGELELSMVSKMRIILADPSQLDALFDVFCHCAGLKPDPEHSGENGWLHGVNLAVGGSVHGDVDMVDENDLEPQFLNANPVGQNGGYDLNRLIYEIKKALSGVRIETSHHQDKIRRYKITGITLIPTNQLIFPVDEQGTRKTEYFWDKYAYRLKYAYWPCLQAGGDSHPVYFPKEVGKIIEGQRYSKKLNEKQVTNIPRATCKRPQEQRIRDTIPHNKYADERFANEFSVNVNHDLVSVPARVLPPHLSKYHGSGREKVCDPSVGQWNIINKKVINGGTVDNWTCLNLSRMRPEEARRFCLDLIHMCNATGMVFNPHPFIEVMSAPPKHIENASRDVRKRAAQLYCRQGKIKRVCESVVSQCWLPKHARKPSRQYLENVASKINLKVLSSMNLPELTKYRGLVSAQPHQQIIEDGASDGQLTHGSHYMTDRSENVLSVPLGLERTIRICIENRSISVNSYDSCTLEAALSSVLEAKGVNLDEFSLIAGAKPLTLSSTLTEIQGSIINANIRLLGGAFTYARIPLEEWIIISRQYPYGFFGRIFVPDVLLGRNMRQKFLIPLGPNGTNLLGMSLVSLENVHCRGRSYGGNFRLRNMFYNLTLRVIEIDAEELPFTCKNYIFDLSEVVTSVINGFLQYEDEFGDKVYPMHVKNLVSHINRLAVLIAANPGYQLHWSKDHRSLVYDHPATWSLCRQINTFTGVMIQYRVGFSEADWLKFDSVMGSGSHADPSCKDWHYLVSRNGAAKELKRVYDCRYKEDQYSNDFKGRFNYCKCVLGHAYTPKLATLASVYLHWEDQLADAHKKLVIDFGRGAAAIAAAAAAAAAEAAGVGDGNAEMAARPVRLPGAGSAPRLPVHMPMIGASGFPKRDDIPETRWSDIKEVLGHQDV